MTDRPSAESRPPAAPPAGDWAAWFAQQGRGFDAHLARYLDELRQRACPGQALAAVAYSLELPGKRARPILVLESCRVAGGQAAEALDPALAVEMIHTFSLIHDDLPAMDDADLRRGKPANHRVFGEADAILAGDWLVAEAFRLLANHPDAALVSRLVGALAEGTQGMVLGQSADMHGEQCPTDSDLVAYIHRHKTAKLIETSCRLGALVAAADENTTERLGRYGAQVGLAFQIADDLLDRTGSSGDLGKPAGADAGKQTWPAAFGEVESRRAAYRTCQAAISELEPLGPEADRLRDLARFVVTRDR